MKNVFQHLGKNGYRVSEISVDRLGRIDLDELREKLDHETALVSIMWANNETGVIFPIRQTAELVKSRGGLSHRCGTGRGKVAIDMKKTPVDLLSISGHKLHAPKGIGVLYLRKGALRSLS